MILDILLSADIQARIGGNEEREQYMINQIDQIDQVLESALMISVQNLATALNTDSAGLHSLLFQLETMKRIRLSNGSSCGSSCSGCSSSCSTENTKTITDRTIVISMIRKHTVSSDE